MTKIIAQKIAYAPDISKIIVFFLLSCVVVVSVLYGFLLRQTILNVVAREEVTKSSAQMLSEIGTLEAQYIQAKGKINLDMAYERGFKDAGTPSFITRATLGRAEQSFRIQ